MEKPQMRDDVFELLTKVFEQEMVGKPFIPLSPKCIEPQEVALDEGFVKLVRFNSYYALKFTTAGHIHYCEECTRRGFTDEPTNTD